MDPQQITTPPDQQIQSYTEPKPPAIIRPISLALAAIALIAIGVFWPHAALPVLQPEKPAAQTAAVILSVADTDIAAHTAIVYDVKSREMLFEKNAYLQWPLASLTKLMLVLTALEELPHDTVITITPPMLLPEGDSGFAVGQTWNIMDLVDAALVSSSNDAAEALALTIKNSSREEAASLMNRNTRLLSLHNTYFLNPIGLDESVTLSGAYGSAHDVAKLLAKLIADHADALDRTARGEVVLTSREGVTLRMENTNESLNGIPGFIAGKTGYTDLAGGNLAVAFDIEPAHSIIIVVLGSTQEGRFRDVETLVRATRDAFQ